jgi:hypothetical protein
VLNALDRLAGTYQSQCDHTAADLAIAEGQLRDHEARIGRPFVHDAYLSELTGLRDQLKTGLSQATPEPGSAPVAELAERIKALKATQTIDAAPERTATRRIAAEEPVTARIRRRAPLAPVVEPVAEAVTPPAATKSEEPIEPPSVMVKALPEAVATVPPMASPSYRQQVDRVRGYKDCQLSLF